MIAVILYVEALSTADGCTVWKERRRGNARGRFEMGAEVEVEVGRDGNLSEHKEITSTPRTSNKMLCK